ncbi:MAG: galactokinase [Sciscionella sp.]|nr:galactokinase [Sciscionella sp.]
MPPAHRAADAFQRLHEGPPSGVWSAPGRVNLIGEHTDYNDGFVLPFALPHRTAVAARRRSDGVLSIATVNRTVNGTPDEIERVDPVVITELRPGSPSGWAAYPCGVAWALREHQVPGVESGADLMIASDVPVGAGLSSSAALECAVALALLGLTGHDVTFDASPTTEGNSVGRVPSRPELARLAQRAENEFVGVPTGILDQTASLCCIDTHVLFLDVRTGVTEQVPFDAQAAGVDVLVIDTKAHHEHSQSGYADRRRSCEEAARLLGIRALRDLAPTDLSDALSRLPTRLRSVVRHIVTENERVLATVELLRAKNIARIGELLTASHVSLRDDFQVSAPELDVSVDEALAEGALGARMTGGGFGGSAIALVPRERRRAVEDAVRSAFAARSFAVPEFFAAAPSPGAGRDT